MRINSFQNNSNKIKFKSLDTNLALGKQLMREFRAEYGRPNSHMWYALLIERRQKNNQSELAWMNDAMSKHKINIYKNIRDYGTFSLQKFESYEDYINKLKLKVKMCNAANCGEQADLMSDIFKNKNINEKQVMLNFTRGLGLQGNSGQHCLNIFGFGDKFVPENPKTWGDESVIADAWANVLIPAKIGLNYYRNLFCRSEHYYKLSVEPWNSTIINGVLVKA